MEDEDRGQKTTEHLKNTCKTIGVNRAKTGLKNVSGSKTRGKR